MDMERWKFADSETDEHFLGFAWAKTSFILCGSKK